MITSLLALSAQTDHPKLSHEIRHAEEEICEGVELQLRPHHLGKSVLRVLQTA